MKKMRKLKSTEQVRSSLLQHVALFKALGTFINGQSQRSWDDAAHLWCASCNAASYSAIFYDPQPTNI